MPAPAQRQHGLQAVLGVRVRRRHPLRPLPGSAGAGGDRAAQAVLQRLRDRPGGQRRVLLRQHQQYPAGVRAGQALAVRRQPGGERRHPLPGQVAGVDDHHRVRGVEVDAEPAGPVAQAVRVPPRRRQQVAEQLAADPRLGVGGGPAEEQQQGGDQGRPLQDPLVGAGQPGTPDSTSAPSCSEPAATAATTQSPARTARPDARDAETASASVARRGSRRAGPVAGEHPAIGVQDEQGAAEDVADRGGDVLHPAAAQHQVGQPVVRRRRPLHRRAVRADQPVGGVQLLQRGPGLLQQPGVVDGHRRVRGERGQQRHLVVDERPLAPVGRHQHADHRRRPAAAARRGWRPAPPPVPPCRSRTCAVNCWSRG